MRALRNFLRIVNRQTVIVSAMAMVSTFACLKLELSADLPSGLIAVAIIFPIVFSINAAYRRREEALRYFASLKGNALALFYAHRDWVPKAAADGHITRFRELLTRLLAAVKDCLMADGMRFEAFLGCCSEISHSHERLRQVGVTPSEVSRANQYLRDIVRDFEQMRNIARYRTPITLRAYSQVFLNSFPILFGPYFAYLGGKYYPAVGYAIAVLYSLVLVSLDNIQEDLENPYDRIGEDDIQLEVMEDYKKAYLQD